MTKKNNIVTKIIYFLTAIVCVFMICIFLITYLGLRKTDLLFTVMAILTMTAGIVMSINIIRGDMVLFSRTQFKNRRTQVITGICIIVFVASAVYVSTIDTKLTDIEIFFLAFFLLSGIVFIISPDLVGSEDKKVHKK